MCRFVVKNVTELFKAGSDPGLVLKSSDTFLTKSRHIRFIVLNKDYHIRKLRCKTITALNFRRGRCAGGSLSVGADFWGASREMGSMDMEHAEELTAILTYSFNICQCLVK